MRSMIRIAVVGAGQFGRNHCRVVRESDARRPGRHRGYRSARAAEAAAAAPAASAFTDFRELAGKVDAAIVAAPTTSHAEVGCELLEAGIDVLVEKPIAPDLPRRPTALIETAERRGRILQVGHLERFNPAVSAWNSAPRSRSSSRSTASTSSARAAWMSTWCST